MLYFPSSDTERSQASRAVSRGQWRRLATRLYSDDLTTPPEDQVRRHWATIVSRLLPAAVITYRSAFAMRPEERADGLRELWISHPRRSRLHLPGLDVVPDGSTVGPAPGDSPLTTGLFVASTARGLLDNVPESTVGRRSTRLLTRSELHDQIVGLVTSLEPARLAVVEDEVEALGALRGRGAQAESIRVFLASARGDRPTVSTDSSAMRAAQTHQPFDPRRLELFDAVVDDLRDLAPQTLLADEERQRYLPFWEAYFSNYIEGTEFDVEEAEEMVFEGRVIASRPADSHDLLGTYAVVSDAAEMSHVAAHPAEFLEILRARHRSILGGRPDERPGEFKDRSNRAGSTRFLDPALVVGTLTEGWLRLDELEDPFQRAAYTMFLVSEVHPFGDGNGRTARLMMNAELVRAGHTRIVLPTVLRNEYLAALSAISHNARVDALPRVLRFAQRFTHALDCRSVTASRRQLEVTNAFMDSSVAEREGRQLTMPGR